MVKLMMSMALWTGAVMIFGLCLDAGKGAAPPLFQLDMAPDSVDDMYSGCKEKMAEKVRRFYLPEEKKKERNFSVAWAAAEREYGRRGRTAASGLKKEQVLAIYAYTLDTPNIYRSFDTAVRTQRPRYGATFRYRSLHFHLTDAIQTLNGRRPPGRRCLTVFRRLDARLGRDVLDRHVRFGAFTSASTGWYPSAARFGDASCLEVLTCFGADVSLYSGRGEAEREALVPPYEVFKVTKVERRSERSGLPCETLYKLKSTGTAASTLNCALV